MTTAERRRVSRLAPRSLRVADEATLRPGQVALVVDLSPLGALVEVAWPQRPGAAATLALMADTGEAWAMRSLVSRCSVAALSPLRFRAAHVFLEPWPG